MNEHGLRVVGKVKRDTPASDSAASRHSPVCGGTYRKHSSSFCFTGKFETHPRLSHGQGQVRTSRNTSICFPDIKFALCLDFGFELEYVPFENHFCVCLVFFLEGVNTPAPSCAEVVFYTGQPQESAAFQPRLI